MVSLIRCTPLPDNTDRAGFSRGKVGDVTRLQGGESLGREPMSCAPPQRQPVMGRACLVQEPSSEVEHRASYIIPEDEREELQWFSSG